MADLGDFITWRQASFNSERAEFERVNDEWAGTDDPYERQKDLRYLELLYESSPVETLSSLIWRKLANTGSWSVRNFDDLFADMRKDAVKRNIARIVMHYFNGPGRSQIVIDKPQGEVECPIILYTPENEGAKYTLVAGNHRLGVARALGITPKVVILRTDW